jgi:hypothetical protein
MFNGDSRSNVAGPMGSRPTVLQLVHWIYVVHCIIHNVWGIFSTSVLRLLADILLTDVCVHFVSDISGRSEQNKTLFLDLCIRVAQVFFYSLQRRIFFTLDPRTMKTVTAYFFFLNNGQFSLSLTIRVQKRQITTVCDQIQILLKCAPIIIVTYYFKVSSAKPCIWHSFYLKKLYFYGRVLKLTACVALVRTSAYKIITTIFLYILWSK